MSRPIVVPLVVRTLPLLASSAKLLAWRSESCCRWRWHRFSALKARRPFCRKARQIRNSGRALSGSQVLPTICDAGRQSRSNHRSSLFAPATELRPSPSLANSYRNRDQGSRTHRSFGCAVVSRRGRSGRLHRARHRCNGPPSERLCCWHLGRREVRAMAWSDPGPDALLEHTRVFPQRN